MTPEEIAQRVFQLSEESKKIEQELAKLKTQLKEKGSNKYGEFIVCVSEAYRETFALKEFKEEFPDEWEQYSPFIKGTTYQTVKVTKAREVA